MPRHPRFEGGAASVFKPARLIVCGARIVEITAAYAPVIGDDQVGDITVMTPSTDEAKVQSAVDKIISDALLANGEKAGLRQVAGINSHLLDPLH